MARRSRRDDSVEFAKTIAVLGLLGLLALTGGNVKRAVEFFVPLVMITILLVGAGVVLYYLFRKLLSVSLHAGASRNLSNATRMDSTSNREYLDKGCILPREFTSELLNQLEWRRFEMLIQALFQAEGLVASRIRAGADGGVDLVLRESPYSPVTAIVQCKAWNAYPVGVKPVRELFGVMHAEGVSRACFFTSGHYTSEARSFANGKPMSLVDGKELLHRLNALEKSKHDSILAEITANDFTTPTCPSCDMKMVQRSSRYGEFWGCCSYPRCKQKFRIRK